MTEAPIWVWRSRPGAPPVDQHRCRFAVITKPDFKTSHQCRYHPSKEVNGFKVCRVHHRFLTEEKKA